MFAFGVVGWRFCAALLLALALGGCALRPVAALPESPSDPERSGEEQIEQGFLEDAPVAPTIPVVPPASGPAAAARIAESEAPDPVVPVAEPLIAGAAGGDVPAQVQGEGPPEEPSGVSAQLQDSERWAIPDRREIDEVVAEFSGPRRRVFAQALERSGRYLPMIRRVLEEHQLPPELAYLPLVESHYTPDARSRSGAVGLWQFIDTTARASGLRVDWWVDERLDPELSTHAAARHLRELFERFQDWELSLAAYNAGPGGVTRALERSGAENFWELAGGGWLRWETRRYLPKLYASLEIASDLEGYGFAPGGVGAEWVYDTVRVASPVDLYTVGRTCGIGAGELQRLNPGLTRRCTPPGVVSYPLRVPAGRGESVERTLDTLPPGERTDFLRYQVRVGDTLWGLARRFDTQSAAIAEINGVHNVRLLRPGQQLVVPVRTGRARGHSGFKGPAAGVDRKPGAGIHVVRPGDTVAALARAYGVPVAEVLRWNNLDIGGLIHPGEQLLIGAGRVDQREQVARARVHVVEHGDTLWGISRRYGIPLDALLRANGLGLEAILRPGDEVVLDGAGPS